MGKDRNPNAKAQVFDVFIGQLLANFLLLLLLLTFPCPGAIKVQLPIAKKGGKKKEKSFYTRKKWEKNLEEGKGKPLVRN